MAEIFTADALIALLTLTVMEVVLGIDNIVFISILSGKLPEEQRPRARVIGLGVAMISRIALLFAISWVIGLTAPLFTVFGFTLSGRDLILLGGGLFLLWKATTEIHHRLEGESESHGNGAKVATFGAVIVQILILDVVFSLDSVITAVGMADQLWVMVTAVVIAVGVMMLGATPISNFVEAHPTVKMLALSFLLLIGVSLVAEGVGQHIPKGYIYFAMAFSVLVEVLNLRVSTMRDRKRQPVRLRQSVNQPPALRSGEQMESPD